MFIRLQRKVFGILGIAVMYVSSLPTVGQIINCEYQQPDTSKARVTDQVNIVLRAVDKDDRPVILGKEDLRLLDDGVPQEIMTLERQPYRPFSVAILIDVSASQEGAVQGSKLAARTFVDALLRSDKNRVSLTTFTSDLVVEQDLTSNPALLHAAIDRVKFVPPPGYIGGGIVVPVQPGQVPQNNQAAGATAIWDTISFTYVRLSSQQTSTTRRAIILLTDGEDTISKSKIKDAVASAIRAQVAVFSIGIGDKRNFGLNKESLKKLSEQTGGRAFFPTKVGDIDPVFSALNQDLRSEYVVTYSRTGPRNSNDFHKLQIELLNPELRKQKVRIVHAQGYFD